MTEELLHAPPPETRQRLLDVALDLFSRKGYAATSVRELVEAAGVTKPVLYYYFKSKEGLYLSLVGSAIADFTKAAAQLRQKPGGIRERVRNYCLALFDIFKARLAVARLIFSIYYGPPQGAPFYDFDAIFSGMLEDIRGMVDDGVSAGEMHAKDAEDASWLVISTLNISMEECLCHSEAPRIDRQRLGNMIELLFRGIQP